MRGGADSADSVFVVVKADRFRLKYLVLVEIRVVLLLAAVRSRNRALFEPVLSSVFYRLNVSWSRDRSFLLFRSGFFSFWR